MCFCELGSHLITGNVIMNLREQTWAQAVGALIFKQH